MNASDKNLNSITQIDSTNQITEEEVSSDSMLFQNSYRDTTQLCQIIYDLSEEKIDTMTINDCLELIKEPTQNIQNEDTLDRVMSGSVMEFLFNMYGKKVEPKAFISSVEAYNYKIQKIMWLIESDENRDKKFIQRKKAALGILIRVSDYAVLTQTMISKWIDPLERMIKNEIDKNSSDIITAAEKAEKATKAAEKATKAADEATQSADEATEQAKNLMSQIASIIAIFTALAFAVTGGMTSLNSLFDQSSSTKIVLVGAVWGIIMIIIFVLLGTLIWLIITFNSRANIVSRIKKIGMAIIAFVIGALFFALISLSNNYYKKMEAEKAAQQTETQNDSKSDVSNKNVSGEYKTNK